MLLPVLAGSFSLHVLKPLPVADVAAAAAPSSSLPFILFSKLFPALVPSQQPEVSRGLCRGWNGPASPLWACVFLWNLLEPDWFSPPRVVCYCLIGSLRAGEAKAPGISLPEPHE